jgi:hypothetical protein
MSMGVGIRGNTAALPFTHLSIWLCDVVTFDLLNPRIQSYNEQGLEVGEMMER